MIPRFAALLALLALASPASAQEPEPAAEPNPVVPEPAAVPAAEPAPTAEAAPAPGPERASPRDPAPPPVAPSPFFRPGLLVSVDDVLPLLALGSTTPVYGRNALQLGESTSFTLATTPRLPFVDVVLGRFTVGGTLAPSFRVARDGSGERTTSSYLGVAVRGGLVLPLGGRLALWPRLGLEHERSLGTAYYDGRTQLTGEARLAWILDGGAALTAGVAARVPVATERELGPAAGSEIGARDGSARVTVGLGFVTRLDGAGTEADEASARARFPAGTVLVGLDQLVEVFGWEREHLVVDREPGKAPDPTLDRESSSARLGLVETRGLLPRAPRLSVDVLVGRVLTIGASGGIGHTRSTATTDLVPSASGAPEVLAWTLAPRVGALVPLAPRLALWPRVGLSWAESHGSRGDVGDLGSHQVSASADVHLAVRLTSRLFLAAGPSASLPLWGRTDVITPGDGRTSSPSIRRGDLAVTNVGLGGMVGLSL